MVSIIFLLSLLGQTAHAQCATPTVTSLSPGVSSVSGGATFTVQGQGFCPGVTVDFGQSQAVLTAQTAVSIQGIIPAGAPGNVQVTVTNQGAQGVSFQNAFTYVVPTGAFTVSAGSNQFGSMRQTLNFYGYVAGGFPPFTYFWNFGDGGTANTKNGSHAYQAANTYEVTFVVFDSRGNMAFSSTIAYVSGPISNFLLDGRGQRLTDASGAPLLAE